MLICEVCKSVFSAAWSESQRLCGQCLATYRRMQAQREAARQRQRELQRTWVDQQVRAWHEQQAGLKTLRFRVAMGQVTDWPGSVSGPNRRVPGDAIAEVELILLDLYEQLTPREWLALGELNGTDESDRGNPGDLGDRGGRVV